MRPHICKQKEMPHFVAGDEAIVIWTKLRSCHRDAFRRQRQCLKSGAAAETIKLWKFQKQLEFVLPYMANRKRCGNVQHSDDEESQPQFEHTDTSPSENLESCNVESVTQNNGDVETKNNDSHEEIDRSEDTAESVETTSSFVKKQISKQPP
jgi:hypothetical protein